MFRIKSDLQNLDIKFYSFDELSIKNIVLKSFKEEIYNRIKDNKHKEINQLSNSILSNIKDNLHKNGIDFDDVNKNDHAKDKKYIIKENKTSTNTLKQNDIVNSYVKHNIDLCSKCIDFIKHMSYEINNGFDNW